jgi:hypothetical protein
MIPHLQAMSSNFFAKVSDHPAIIGFIDRVTVQIDQTASKL